MGIEPYVSHILRRENRREVESKKIFDRKAGRRFSRKGFTSTGSTDYVSDMRSWAFRVQAVAAWTCALDARGSRTALLKVSRNTLFSLIRCRGCTAQRLVDVVRPPRTRYDCGIHHSAHFRRL